MSAKLNINILLCKSYDDEKDSINEIFDEINIDEKNEAVFSMIVLVNFLNAHGKNYYAKMYALHYNEETKKNRYIHLENFLIPPKKETCVKNIDRSSPTDIITGFTVFRFNPFHFPDKGKYEIRIYLKEIPNGKNIDEYILENSSPEKNKEDFKDISFLHATQTIIVK